MLRPTGKMTCNLAPLGESSRYVDTDLGISRLSASCVGYRSQEEGPCSVRSDSGSNQHAE